MPQKHSHYAYKFDAGWGKSWCFTACEETLVVLFSHAAAARELLARSFFTFGEPGIFYLIASFLVRRVNILIKLFEWRCEFVYRHLQAAATCWIYHRVTKAGTTHYNENDLHDGVFCKRPAAVLACMMRTLAHLTGAPSARTHNMIAPRGEKISFLHNFRMTMYTESGLFMVMWPRRFTNACCLHVKRIFFLINCVRICKKLACNSPIIARLHTQYKVSFK